jgi:quinol monooxygenase YgiN
MVILAVTAKIKPDHRAEAVEIALQMVAETRKEEGCVAYTFHSPLDDPNTFFVYEEWATEEALNGHMQSDHMKVFQSRMPAVLDGNVEVKRYDVP